MDPGGGGGISNAPPPAGAEWSTWKGEFWDGGESLMLRASPRPVASLLVTGGRFPSMHLSRISYELFMKCVTPNVTTSHVMTWLVMTRLVMTWLVMTWLVVTSRDTLEIFFEPFKIFATTWHALQYFTQSRRIPTHCHKFFRHLHVKLRATG